MLSPQQTDPSWHPQSPDPFTMGSTLTAAGLDFLVPASAWLSKCRKGDFAENHVPVSAYLVTVIAASEVEPA